MDISLYGRGRKWEGREAAILSVTQGTLIWRGERVPFSLFSPSLRPVKHRQAIRGWQEKVQGGSSVSVSVPFPWYQSLFMFQVNMNYQAVLIKQLFSLSLGIFSGSCRADLLHLEHKSLLPDSFSSLPPVQWGKDSWLCIQRFATLKESTTLRWDSKGSSFDTKEERVFVSWVYKKVPSSDQSWVHAILNTKPGIKTGKPFLLNRILCTGQGNAKLNRCLTLCPEGQ